MMNQVQSWSDSAEAAVPPSKEEVHDTGLRQAIGADIRRYRLATPVYPAWLLVLTTQGLWLSLQYRTSRWVDQHCHIPGIRTALKLICAILQKLVEIVTSCELPNKANIGPGLFIPHACGIIVHTEAQIGKNCSLAQQVTVGFGGRGPKAGTPRIGDGVYFGAGAKVFGNITVGHNVAIGANAVVNKDLPDNAVAVGVPAKVVSDKGAQDFLLVD